MKLVMFSRGLVLAMVLAASTSNAESPYPVPPAKQISLSKGMMCDTEGELTDVLDFISAHDRSPVADELPPTCGMFQSDMRLMFIAQPLHWYDNGDVHTLVTKFTYIGNGWVQYGWLAFMPKEEGETAEQDA